MPVLHGYSFVLSHNFITIPLFFKTMSTEDSLQLLFPELSKSLKLGWLITGNPDVAGARLHGWAMHTYFTVNGLTSRVAWASTGYQNHLKLTMEELQKVYEFDVNVLVLQGVKSMSLEDEFFKQCSHYKIKTVLIDSDLVNIELASRCDAVIVVSDYLKSLFPDSLQEKVFVAIDHYDHDGSQVKVQSDKKELDMCFLSNNVFNTFPGLTSLPENTHLKIIGPPKKRVKKYTPHKKVFTKTPFAFDYLVWSLETVEENILNCDIALIPYPEDQVDAEYIKRKSNNRLILFMSYGLPCIVSPIKPYTDVIRHGENGFIAKTAEDWKKYVCLLRDDPALRKKIADTARSEVLEKYSVHTQAKQYLSVIANVLKR